MRKPKKESKKKVIKEKSIFGSPLEEKFFKACEKAGITLIPQFPVESFRLDFLLETYNPLIKIAIEIDGSRFHKTKKQMTSDYKRQRLLRLKGFEMIRFTGQEIYYEIDYCVQELIKFRDLILKTYPVQVLL